MASDRSRRKRLTRPAAAFLVLLLLVVLPMVAATQEPTGTQFDRGLAAFLDGAYEDALQLWLPLADAGDREAQYGIGLMHEMGRGVPPNAFQAARWYRRAAGQNHEAAQLSLGRLHASGRGVPQDPVRAVAWYRRAAEQGNPQAQYLLARSLLEGRGVAQNRAAGARWLQRAAAASYLPAEVLRRTLDGGVVDEAEDGGAAVENDTRGAEEGEEVAEPEIAVADPEEMPAEPAAEGQMVERGEPEQAGEPQETNQEARVPDAQVIPNERDQIRGFEPSGAFAVRVGTFQSNDAAVVAWQDLISRYPKLLKGLSARVSELSVGGRGATFYRLDVVPLSSESDAVALCAALRKAGQYCFPVRG